MYELIKPLLFGMEAERAHQITLRGLDLAHRLGTTRWLPAPAPCRPRHAMGLTFPNPVGLAAGLDKNGAHIDALATLGFGFIEVGTITPRPQPGNPRPRLFRLPGQQAIINRFGFNNAGVDALLENLKHTRYRGILGINVGKNFDTPLECAHEDYLACLHKVYPVASYVTVNISSPNTQNLRQLQEGAALQSLLGQLKTAQSRLADQHGRYVPIALKIAPDLDPTQLANMATLLRAHRMDAVIAGNTTLAREELGNAPHAHEPGGLSGAPLRDKATQIVRQLAQSLAGEIPIIGVGGILSGQDAQEKIEAGACLVQVYTGLVYRGPALVREICTTLG